MNSFSLARRTTAGYDPGVVPQVQNLLEASGSQRVHTKNFRRTLKMEKISPLGQIKFPSKGIWKCLGAEFVGTFILMFFCCGASLYTKEEAKPPLVAVALSWGLAVATLAQTLGHVSGCHMNPAVTLAMLVTGKTELIKSLLYMIIQCVSSIAAIAALKALTPEYSKGGYGVISVAEDLTKMQGVGIEFLSTFVLVLTIFSVSDENRIDVKGSPPLAIGLCIMVLIFLGADMTGTGLNPARALGPAVIMGVYDDQWVYWVAPIGGALTAAIVYEHVFRSPRPDEVEIVEADQLKVRGGNPPRPFPLSCY